MSPRFLRVALRFAFTFLAGTALAPRAARCEPAPRAASIAALSASLPPDTVIESLSGGYAVVAPEPFAAPAPAAVPRRHFRTTRALYVYETEPGGAAVRRVTLHFEPDDRAPALLSARLIARLLRLHREHFSRETLFPRAAPAADVWFVPSVAPGASEGGETQGTDIYVFAASAIPPVRAPLELARTVAHELGHLTLPAARGYAEPESDAAGYLGERLYLGWVRDDVRPDKTAAPPDGTDPDTLRLYYNRQIAPLIARYAKGGPESATLRGDRTEAMDYYIGACLAADATFGGVLFGNALYSIADTAPRDFLHALAGVTAPRIQSPAGLALRGGGGGAWVYLVPGRYRAMRAFFVSKGGWYRVEAGGAAGGTVLVRVGVNGQ